MLVIFVDAHVESSTSELPMYVRGYHVYCFKEDTGESKQL